MSAKDKQKRIIILFLYFCPETKVPKILHSKRGDGSHPYQQKPKFLRVYADFPSFAVEAYLLSFGVVLTKTFENPRGTIQTYI